jgi:Flp pilus assembly protein TadD
LAALFTASCGGSPSRSSEADSLVSKGLQAEAAERFQLAANDFRSAASKDHSDAIPYFELGVLYQRIHDSTKAATAYKQALSLEPKYKKAMFNLAVVDTPTQPQAAMNLYNELRLQNPKDAQVDFNLGLLLIAQSQPTPGHQLLKQAVSLDPMLAKRLPAGMTP